MRVGLERSLTDMNKPKLHPEDQSYLVYYKACQLGEYIRTTPVELLEQVLARLVKSKSSSAYSEADRLAEIMIQAVITAARRAAESRA